jgi:hypothetical protein
MFSTAFKSYRYYFQKIYFRAVEVYGPLGVYEVIIKQKLLSNE